MNCKNTTRREFLKAVAGSSLLMALPMSWGCQQTQGVAVSLVKDPDDSYALKRALQLVGGLSFLKPGDSVLLKPAINSCNPFPATTSPFIISELITILKDRGAGDIFVGDLSPTLRDTMHCMQETGIYQAVIDSGAQMVAFEDEDMVHVQPELAVHWPQGFSVPSLFNKVDHIISLPRFSTHGLAGYSMGIKNFVGAISYDERIFLHITPDFFPCIAEIPLCTDKIRLSILDARKGFSHGGPDTGTLITPGIIMASKNLVAADTVGLALLKTIGTTSNLMNRRVWDDPVIKRSVEVLSPSLRLESMDLRSEGIENIDAIREQLL
jgi:uncharacterized protein (DUF362 family)